jgi:hypothetical protein
MAGQRVGVGGEHCGDFRPNRSLEKSVCHQGDDLVALIASIADPDPRCGNREHPPGLPPLRSWCIARLQRSARMTPLPTTARHSLNGKIERILFQSQHGHSHSES